MARLLLVAPDEPLREALRAHPLLAEHELEVAAGDVDALCRLRRRAYDVLVTCPWTSVEEDLVLLHEARAVRPGVRGIVLTPHATPSEVIAALRDQVFACFSTPFDLPEIADMLLRAVEAEDWTDGIQVISARPDWISLRVNCRLLTAERVVRFLSEMRQDVADHDRDVLMAAFREVLVNAMEHGGGFDPEQVVEVAAVRTERTIVFYVRDPGPGFDPSDVAHAAIGNPAADPLAHAAERAARGLRPGGFGLLLTRAIVDELIYSERGNEVLLIKHLR